jgi:PIN domain nuclease of toxin-antitoxin system
LAEPDRPSLKAQRELNDDGNELWLSPVSTWKALLLIAKGRLRKHG